MKKIGVYSLFVAFVLGLSPLNYTFASASDIVECGYQEVQCSLTAIPSQMIRQPVLNEHLRVTERFGLEASRPHIPFDASVMTQSTNWSGYAALTHLDNPKNYSVEQVSGSWIVPTVSATHNDSYSVAWVGIDGYFSASQTVEQIGTFHNWVNGSAQYGAWFEMYPQGSYSIDGFPVNPGDKISANVKYLEHNVFELSISNKTQKVYAKIPKSYTVQPLAVRTSAEWIVEAPSDSISGSILPLANFGTVHFFECEAVIRDREGSISNKHWENSEITMVNDAGSTKASVSSLECKGHSFDVTWVSE